MSQSHNKLLQKSTRMHNELTNMDNRLNNINNKLECIKRINTNLKSHICLISNDLYEYKIQRCHGNHLWIVDNFAWRCNESFKRTLESYHSISFSTSNQKGYNFYLKILLNKNNKKDDGYMSVYIVSTTGDYDDILKWPFEGKITFKLISPSNSGLDNITKSLLLNDKSSPFSAPIEGNENMCGITDYISINDLKKYIVNDKIYLEATVIEKIEFEIFSKCPSYE